MKEIWKPIKKFPMYFVSNMGHVKNLKKIIRPVQMPKGCPFVNIGRRKINGLIEFHIAYVHPG